MVLSISRLLSPPTILSQLPLQDAVSYIQLQVRFVTKIYHPLVDKDEGKFCNEAIASSWKAVSNLTTVVNTVFDMLQVKVKFLTLPQNYANCEMALDPDIGDEVRNNREAFDNTAREWTEKYACQDICWRITFDPQQYEINKDNSKLFLWLRNLLAKPHFHLSID